MLSAARLFKRLALDQSVILIKCHLQHLIQMILDENDT